MLLEKSLFEAIVSSVTRAVSIGIAESELQLWLAWSSSSQRSVGTRGKLSRAITTCELIFKVGEFGVRLGQSSEF
jgi:hypothetical protein